MSSETKQTIADLLKERIAHAKQMERAFRGDAQAFLNMADEAMQKRGRHYEGRAKDFATEMARLQAALDEFTAQTITQ